MRRVFSEAGYMRTLLERDLSVSAVGIDDNRAEIKRSQLTGQRIRELRKGLTLGGISIKDLIEEGRE